MIQTWVKFSAFVVAVVLLLPASLLAQKEQKDKEKEVKVKKDVEQIIITRNGDDKAKVIIEINGDKVTVNGKSLDEYKDKERSVTVKRSRYKDYEGLLNMYSISKDGFGALSDYKVSYYNAAANHAMLGVTTEKTDEGVKVNSITKESAAENVGLKEGDIITKVDDKKIETPDDLSAVIKSHKPGDKVVITYLRDKKEQKATAELTKWKGMNVFGTTAPGQNFKMDLGGMDFDKEIPRVMRTPRTPGANGQLFNWSGGTPKLGLSVQDTDDGKGVKVIEVDEESNAAKAGIKEDDVVTEVDGKVISNTDDMVKIIKDSKEKISVMIKLQRAGKIQNIEVKIPRKVKTADL